MLVNLPIRQASSDILPVTDVRVILLPNQITYKNVPNKVDGSLYRAETDTNTYLDEIELDTFRLSALRKGTNLKVLYRPKCYSG